MKVRSIVLATAVCLALVGLAACGGSGSNAPKDNAPEPEPTHGAAPSDLGDFSHLFGMSGQEAFDAMSPYVAIDAIDPASNYPGGDYASTENLTEETIKPGDWVVSLQTGTFNDTEGVDYVSFTLCSSELKNANTVRDVDYQSLVDNLRKNIDFSKIVIYTYYESANPFFQSYFVLKDGRGCGMLGGELDGGLIQGHMNPFCSEEPEDYVLEEIEDVKKYENRDGGYEILYLEE